MGSPVDYNQFKKMQEEALILWNDICKNKREKDAAIAEYRKYRSIHQKLVLTLARQEEYFQKLSRQAFGIEK